MSWRLLRTWPDPEMQRKALWVADMMGASEVSADDIGISPAAIVAQAALETGWGKGLVGTHNLFGIKATSDWKGDRVLVTTREVVDGQSIVITDWFRDYPDFAASIADHLAFLRTNSRYRAAGVFDHKGDAAYFAALQRGGYATDPNYAAQLGAMLSTVNSYFLPYMANGSAAVVPRARPWLMVGSCGASVLELQRRLTTGGWDTSGVDGQFGGATFAAVKRFQSDKHLAPIDGVVGDATWAAIDRLAA